MPPLGSGFGGEGEVPGVTRDLSGRGRGLDGGAGLFLSSSHLLRGLGRVGAEVRQRQGDGSNIVDSEQNLQGADFIETLITQSFTGPLNLLNARRERTDPTACGQKNVVD